jgi:hypothetical protein
MEKYEKPGCTWMAAPSAWLRHQILEVGSEKLF